MCACVCVSLCFQPNGYYAEGKNWKKLAANVRACVWARARVRAHKCVINVPSIQFLYTCSNIYYVIANNVCDNLSISASILSMLLLLSFRLWFGDRILRSRLRLSINWISIELCIHHSQRLGIMDGWADGRFLAALWSLPLNMILLTDGSNGFGNRRSSSSSSSTTHHSSYIPT